VIGKPVSARAALPVVVGNYETCKMALDRLGQLQGWVTGQIAAGL